MYKQILLFCTNKSQELFYFFISFHTLSYLFIQNKKPLIRGL
uniref:Uncharacterized protein n=1 Tax=Siphoviridae sp. ct4Z13 TaxID=2827778 RepID=A0A8S5SC29_9CAUD|nr:MAG TPA: hypothetical protein [Siphoviridae sp. ct4Z13]